MSDYPDNEELKTLREWDRSAAELIRYLRSDHWWMPDWGAQTLVADEYGDEGTGYVWLRLSTGGWSGNEDRIDALERSGQLYAFWGRYWYSSRVGGHYEFRIPDAQLNEPIKSIDLNAVSS